MTVMEQLPTRRAARAAAIAPATAPSVPAPIERTGWRAVVHAVGMGLSTGFLLLMLGLLAAVVVVPLAVGGSPLTVLTSSMEPKLPPGTLVVVKPTPIEEIGVGQVLTYQLRSGEPELVTHRVVERLVATDGTISFLTQGDNNGLPDPVAVREVQIRGTVWYAIPYLGWVNQWLTGDTRAILVPVLAGLLFAYAGWMIVSAIRDRHRARRATAEASAAANAPGSDVDA